MAQRLIVQRITWINELISEEMKTGGLILLSRFLTKYALILISKILNSFIPVIRCT